MAVPFLASSVFAISPSRAATSALSEGQAVFTGFSLTPASTFTNTDTNTTSVSLGGAVEARADATALLNGIELLGFNTSSSDAKGENGDYVGVAQSEARLEGIFEVKENTLFSFDFAAYLMLATSIDNAPAEKAKASGNVFFALLDTSSNSILDSFNLRGNVEAQSNQNFLTYGKSDSVTFSNLVSGSNFGSNEEFAFTTIEGS